MQKVNTIWSTLHTMCTSSTVMNFSACRLLTKKLDSRSLYLLCKSIKKYCIILNLWNFLKVPWSFTALTVLFQSALHEAHQVSFFFCQLFFSLTIFLFLTLLVALNEFDDFLHSSLCFNLTTSLKVIFCLNTFICSLNWLLEFMNGILICFFIIQINSG